MQCIKINVMHDGVADKRVYQKNKNPLIKTLSSSLAPPNSHTHNPLSPFGIKRQKPKKSMEEVKRWSPSARPQSELHRLNRRPSRRRKWSDPLKLQELAKRSGSALEALKLSLAVRAARGLLTKLARTRSL